MDVIFSKDVEFIGTEKSEVTEKCEIFYRPAEFREIEIGGKCQFEKANLSRISFIDTDIRKIDFLNCKWHKDRWGRRLLYDELELFKDKKKQGEDKIKKVEILYRRLKQKYTDEHDWPEVSNWHYGEKEMYRKGDTFRLWNPLSLSNLYWFSSGYGERPVRAGLVLLGLFAVLSILTGFTNLGLATSAPFGAEDLENFNALPFWRQGFAYLLNIFQLATFKSPYLEPLSLGGGVVKLLAQVWIPIQAALFAVAVRNSFRR